MEEAVMARMSKTGEKNVLLPNPLASGRKPPACNGIDKKKLETFGKLIMLDKHEEVAGMLKACPEDTLIVAKFLSDERSIQRMHAVLALWNAAEKGVDLTAVMPALVKTLEDESVFVRRNAARAMGTWASKAGDITVAVPSLAKLLDYGDTLVRTNAAEALGRACHQKGTDITVAIPGLVRLLEDGSERLRRWAAWDLNMAASKGADIAIALPAFVKKLGDKDVTLRRNASGALRAAAENGAEITDIITDLVKALDDSDSYVRMHAVMALRVAAEKRADLAAAIPALFNALRDGNTKGGITGTLENVAANYENTRTLITHEIIEFTHSEWFQKEMVRNSVKYENIAAGIAHLLGRMKESEAPQP
jgi:HEAT repeat protein